MSILGIQDSVIRDAENEHLIWWTETTGVVPAHLNYALEVCRWPCHGNSPKQRGQRSSSQGSPSTGPNQLSSMQKVVHECRVQRHSDRPPSSFFRSYLFSVGWTAFPPATSRFPVIWTSRSEGFINARSVAFKCRCPASCSRLRYQNQNPRHAGFMTVGSEDPACSRYWDASSLI